MLELAVNSTVRAETHYVESVAGSCIFHSLEQHLVGVEFAGADRLVDARQILQHHISGTDVGVSNLGVANLPVGKSDVFTAGFKGDDRVFGEKPVKVRLVSSRMPYPSRIISIVGLCLIIAYLQSVKCFFKLSVLCRKCTFS